MLGAVSIMQARGSNKNKKIYPRKHRKLTANGLYSVPARTWLGLNLVVSLRCSAEARNYSFLQVFCRFPSFSLIFLGFSWTWSKTCGTGCVGINKLSKPA